MNTKNIISCGINNTIFIISNNKQWEVPRGAWFPLSHVAVRLP
jgi:hypothetical protein